MPMCFPIGWFLGLLFQLQLLGPWIGIVAVKQPKATIIGLLTLCVASWSYAAYITDARDFRLNPMDTKHGYDHWSNECKHLLALARGSHKAPKPWTRLWGGNPFLTSSALISYRVHQALDPCPQLPDRIHVRHHVAVLRQGHPGACLDP